MKVTVSVDGLKRQKNYEPPKSEVVIVESQGVLCASAPVSFGAGTGSTESMTISDITI